MTDSSHGSLPQDGDDVSPQGTADVGLEDVALDVNTEAVNDTPSGAPSSIPGGTPSHTDGEGAGSAPSPEVGPDAGVPGPSPDTALAAERLADLQRLQAEYVNYKRRVDRDRAMVQELAVHSVIEALLPVLDDIHAARQHGDLESGPFAAIADKLEATLGKFGLQRFGGPGEPFDPSLHEALMHAAWPEDGSLPEGAEATTVVQVLQPGYRAGERVIRPARVAVADPQ